MSPKPYSLSKQLVVAASVVRDAMRADDTRAQWLALACHAFYDRFTLNRSASIARNEGAARRRAIDDDGLPARPAVPWLAIPSGLGHAVLACPRLPRILRLPHDYAGRETVAGCDLFPLSFASPDPGINPACLGYCIARTALRRPIIGMGANEGRRYGSSRI